MSTTSRRTVLAATAAAGLTVATGAPAAHAAATGRTPSKELFGGLIGRYGNRIAEGRFTLDGATHRLPLNDGPHSLHGGDQGFDKRLWDIEPFTGRGDVGLVLSRVSPDGEAGYPGTPAVRVVYTLTARGEGSGSVDGHVLELAAARYTPVGPTLIPTGEPARGARTPFDFRRPRAIGDAVRTPHEQIGYGKGIDHNYVLDKGATARATRSAWSPSTSRTPPTSRRSPPRCCAPVTRTARRRCTRSRRADRKGGPAR